MKLPRTFARGLALLLVATQLAVSATASADDFVVVCSRSAGPASMNLDDLRRVFTGRTRQWDSGAVVQTVIIPAESAPETAFLAALLGMTGRELLTRIQAEVFRGEMRRPVIIRSSQDCLAALHNIPSGICIVNASAVASTPADLRVIRVGY